jgi:hypothetical protein
MRNPQLTNTEWDGITFVNGESIRFEMIRLELISRWHSSLSYKKLKKQKKMQW